MNIIPLEAIINQKFSTRLGDSRYELEIKEARGVMVVSIVRDDVPIVTGMRAVSGFPIIPYNYLENGNFAFITANDELPDWNKFGATQNLVYATQAELIAARPLPPQPRVILSRVSGGISVVVTVGGTLNA